MLLIGVFCCCFRLSAVVFRPKSMKFTYVSRLLKGRIEIMKNAKARYQAVVCCHQGPKQSKWTNNSTNNYSFCKIHVRNQFLKKPRPNSSIKRFRLSVCAMYASINIVAFVWKVSKTFRIQNLSYDILWLKKFQIFKRSKIQNHSNEN